jgi:predicted ATPase with chaperone activity
MLSLAFSAAVAGIDAHVVRVETDSAAGVPVFAIVGLLDRALNESRERIRAAIVNSGFGFPPGRLLVNLAPAGMRGSTEYGNYIEFPLTCILFVQTGVRTSRSAWK